MVREARFSWDDVDRREIPDLRDELDGDDLDLPLDDEPTSRRNGKRRAEGTRDRQRPHAVARKRRQDDGDWPTNPRAAE